MADKAELQFYERLTELGVKGLRQPKPGNSFYPTGIKEFDDLMRTAHDPNAKAWKRNHARHRLAEIRHKYIQIRRAINESEDYPYGTILDTIRTRPT